MTAFSGFSDDVFDSCHPSEKIRIPINKFKELRKIIEPELQRINPSLSGHVSRTKKPGTNEYYEWVWLYFNTVGTGANKYSQLTVNISPIRLYVGVNLRTKAESRRFRSEIKKEENQWLLEQILDTLGGREWLCLTRYDYWDYSEPRLYSKNELRGLLFDSELYWINACFERDNPIVHTKKISGEIVQIFNELYNIFALATDNPTFSQPKPASPPYTPVFELDTNETIPRSDTEIESDILSFLTSLKSVKSFNRKSLPGKKDQYAIKRTALKLDLRPFTFEHEGKEVIIYSDENYEVLKENLKNYDSFKQQIDRLTEIFQLPEDFLKPMLVKPITDARYLQNGDAHSILLNLSRFNTNKKFFFWVFAVARELSYIKNKRINYQFINQIRDLMIHAYDRDN